MAEETQRDEQGRFSSDSSKVALDTLPMGQYSEARESGATTTIEKSELEEAPQITGKESQREYDAKRDQQLVRSKGGGYQKRIDQVVKQRETFREENETLRERLARYERGQANGDNNGAETRSQESESYSVEPEQRSETQEPTEPKIAAMRQHYPDWDAVMSRAKNENIRISDEAARVLRSTENAGHISYLLVKDDALRTEFNKLSPERQSEEIRKINGEIGDVHSGRRPFRQKVEAMEAAMPPEERAEVLQAAQKNELGQRIVFSLARELNELSNGTEVFKALIMDPEKCRQLAAMSQTAASLELGRMSARLEPRIVSKSAPPIRPVNSGSTRSTVPLDQMDQQSYNRARDAGRTR